MDRITGVVALLPPDLWPLGCAVAASACVGAVGAFVWQALSAAELPIWSRAALIAIPICAPISSVEPIGNLANIHWFLAYLIAFIAVVRIERPRAAIGWGLVALLCSLSEVQCALVFPVMAYRLIRDRRFRPVAVGWGIGMAAQLAALVASPRTQTAGEAIDAANVARGYLINVVISAVTSVPTRLSELLAAHGFAAPALVLAVYVIACLVMAALGRGIWCWQVPHLLALSVAAWLLSAAFGKGSSTVVFSVDSSLMMRWGTTASMYFLAAGALAGGLVAKRFHRMNIAGIAGLVIAGLLWAPSFRSQLTYGGPAWTSELSEAQSSCALDPAEVPVLETAPDGWEIPVPCEEFH